MAGILDYIKNAVSDAGEQLNPMGNGAVGNAIDYLNQNPNSPIGQKGYFNQQVIQPVEQGVGNFVNNPSLSTFGQGALSLQRGGYNATPLGLVQNAAISSVSSALQAARTGQANPMQAFNNNQQLSQGLGVNGLPGTLLDVGTNLISSNPEGLVSGLRNLGNLSSDASTLGNLGTVGKSVGQFLGFQHPEGIFTGNLSDIYQGVKNGLTNASSMAGILDYIKNAVSDVEGGLQGVKNYATQYAQNIAQNPNQVVSQAIGSLPGFEAVPQPVIQSGLNNFESYVKNQVVDPIASGIAGTQNAIDQYGNAGRNGWTVAGQALPILQGAFNATSPGMAWNARTGAGVGLVNLVEGKGLQNSFNAANQAFTQPTSFAQAGLGIDPTAHPFLAGAIDTAAGNPEGLLGAAANLKNLSTEAPLLQNAGTLLNSAKMGLGFKKPEGTVLDSAKDLYSGAKTILQSVKNTNQSDNLLQAAKLFDTEIPQVTRDASGKFVTPQGQEVLPYQMSTDQYESLARRGQLDTNHIAQEPYKNLQNQEKVTTYIDAQSGKIIAAQGDPLFANYLRDAASDQPYARKGYQSYQDMLESRKGVPADPSQNYSLEGAQFRSEPREETTADMNNFSQLSKGSDILNPDLKAVGNEAFQNKFAIQQQIEQIGNNLAKFLDRNGYRGDDASLLYDAVEHPEDTASLAQESSKDPSQFQSDVARFSKQMKQLDQLRASVGLRNTRGDTYVPHDLTLNVPPDQAEKALEDALGWSSPEAKNFIASSNKDRVIPDLRTALSIQTKDGTPVFRQNDNAADLIKSYTQDQALQAGNKALLDTLNAKAPGHVATDGTNIGTTTTLPGLRGTSFSPELFDAAIKNRESSRLAQTTLGKAISTPTQLLKRVALSISEFHPIKETLNFAGNIANTRDIPRIDKGVAAFFSKGFMDKYEQDTFEPKQWKNWQGSLNEASAKMGVTLGNTEDVGGAKLQTIGRNLNPIKANEAATFDRLIKVYKTETVKSWLEQGGNPDSPEGKQIGAQINNIFGGQNTLVQGLNQEGQFVLRNTLLANDFTTSKVRNVASALVGGLKGSSVSLQGGNYARLALLGTTAVTALGTELLRRAVSGKWDSNVVNAIKDTVLDPQVPLPASFNPPGDNRQQVVHLPGSNVTDLGRLASDPLQFGQGHLAAPFSLFERAANNQDYYGRQVYNPNDSTATKALKVAQGELPIGVGQALKVAQGKESIPAAGLNTLGLRVNTDPNDPSVLTAQGQQKYRSTLNANALAAYNELHTPTKDANGDPIGDKVPFRSPEKALIYLQHPEFLQADATIASQSGGTLDPILKAALSDPKFAAIQLASEVNLPGQAKNTYAKLLQSPQYASQESQYLQDKSAYSAQLSANSQPSQNNPLSQVLTSLGLSSSSSQGGYQPTQMTPQLQQEMSQYMSLPAGSARTLFMAAHPELSSYLSQSTNNQLAAAGLPPASPNSLLSGSTSIGSTGPGGSGKGTGPTPKKLSSRGGGRKVSMKTSKLSSPKASFPKQSVGKFRAATSRVKLSAPRSGGVAKSLSIKPSKAPSSSFSTLETRPIKFGKSGGSGSPGERRKQIRLVNF